MYVCIIIAMWCVVYVSYAYNALHEIIVAK